MSKELKPNNTNKLKDLHPDVSSVTETKEDIKKESKAELSPEERRALKKKEIRRAMDSNRGRLHIDEKHKENGYVYRIVNDSPGRVKELESLGYDIVRDDVPVGCGTQNDGSKLGSAVTLDAGKVRSQPAVLMRIRQEDFEIRQEVKAEILKEKTSQLLNDTGIPTQYGEVNLRKGS